MLKRRMEDLFYKCWYSSLQNCLAFLFKFFTKRVMRCWHRLPRDPEWMPRPWRCSRPGWMGPWAAWDGGGQPCPWQGLGLGGQWGPFQTKPFCESTVLFQDMGEARWNCVLRNKCEIWMTEVSHSNACISKLSSQWTVNQLSGNSWSKKLFNSSSFLNVVTVRPCTLTANLCC